MSSSGATKRSLHALQYAIMSSKNAERLAALLAATEQHTFFSSFRGPQCTLSVNYGPLRVLEVTVTSQSRAVLNTAARILKSHDLANLTLSKAVDRLRFTSTNAAQDSPRVVGALKQLLDGSIGAMTSSRVRQRAR